MVKKNRTYGAGYTADINKAEGPFKITKVTFKTVAGVDPSRILDLVENVRDMGFIQDLREVEVIRNPAYTGIDNFTVTVISKDIDPNLFREI